MKLLESFIKLLEDLLLFDLSQMTRKIPEASLQPPKFYANIAGRHFTLTHSMRNTRTFCLSATRSLPPSCLDGSGRYRNRLLYGEHTPGMNGFARSAWTWGP
ncbi:hypothetical protein AVEN_210979-1 [Araneus ventricosus]|uniref:Uncharacterized protein n=1 Tax=Araneus ventricosus TaxID=182803 RepID=A0A4Y2NBR2_ARAVE|nr:hypothetical protein AVEN_258420-1 [Araneus ventricosus]GBN36194.1 hypothetical protein AVEN_210979-1 [Araneus ventricosus]